MLYLAEVQRKSGGLLGGGGRTELKLLACQRSEQNWVAVSGEDIVPLEEANSYGTGALVLVDLTANRQVQRVQEAGRPLVSILQNFSRLQEKFKMQEEEIEQWKQSLTYQSQELNRREMEMESRREQLQQMEEDFEQLEQQRQELETLQEDINRQRDTYERNRQELEGAWEQLRGQMRRFEEQQADANQLVALDEEKVHLFQDLLDRLAGATPPTEAVREQLNLSFEMLAQHQERLNQHWQRLEQQRSQAQQSQNDVEQQARGIQNRWQEWHHSQESLNQARSELKAQQSALNARQEYAGMLSVQIQNHEDLHQHIYRLAETSDNVKLGALIDIEALEKMSLDELQRLTQERESDLENLSRFVESQEEELTLKQQEIDELRAKIEAANDYDRLNLENELADEQDGYQMLNETLVGQRRNLQERKSILSQHQAVLRRRQGLPLPEGQEGATDLGPLMTQVEGLRQQQADELRKLEAQVAQMKTAIQQAERLVSNQSTEQENKRNELRQLEAELLGRRAAAAEMQGKVNLYEELLQPVQDTADGVRQKLEAIAGTMSQVQETADSQLQAISEMRLVLVSLSDAPELAVS